MFYVHKDQKGPILCTANVVILHCYYVSLVDSNNLSHIKDYEKNRVVSVASCCGFLCG